MNTQTITAQLEQQEQQEQVFIIQTAQQEQISIKPSITECERFIKFLNNRFNLGLRNDLIVLIHETKPTIKGFFRYVGCRKMWQTAETEKTPFKQQPINSIVLSSHTLQDTPYETLAHETAHYVNFLNNIKDCTNNGYHNKHFKTQAEKMLLSVPQRDKRKGYAYTEETQPFKNMVNKEFIPSPTAFKVFQEIAETETKTKSRLLLFECGCGCKIRTARNEEKPLNAICQYCNSEFLEVTQ